MADILIVEDDPAVSKILAMLLEMHGHTTRLAATGYEGLERLRERRPDLTISDIEMPDLDGPAMSARMLIEDQGLEKIPLILVSGLPEIDRLAQKVGTPYFISKPFDVEAMLDLVQLALSERISPAPFEQRSQTCTSDAA